MKKKNRIVIFMVVFLFLSLFVSLAYSGNFKLVKVNAHYEPELKSKEDPAIILPGTKIKAGLYRYYTDDGGFTGKIGFAIDNERFYFLQSRRPEGKPGIEWQYGLAGDITYGIYKNYFLLEASAGGTTRNSYLFLFKYDKGGVQFLDAIAEAVMPSKESLDFISLSKQRKKDGFPAWGYGKPIWMDIEDIDSDGRPEFKIITSTGFKFESYFQLYLEIREDRLKVDFNPHLYKALFEEEKHKSQGRVRSDQYYIYGYLAKEISLDEIKQTLKSTRYRLFSLIENIGKLDNAFHESIKDERFILKQYNMQGR